MDEKAFQPVLKVSALRSVGDIGQGASLGSNALAIPLVVTIAYWASRKSQLGGGTEQGESREEHRRHREEGLMRMKSAAVLAVSHGAPESVSEPTR